MMGTSPHGNDDIIELLDSNSKDEVIGGRGISSGRSQGDECSLLIPALFLSACGSTDANAALDMQSVLRRKEEAARDEQERQQMERLRIFRQEEVVRIEQTRQQLEQLRVKEEELRRQEEAARIEQERLQMEQRQFEEEERRRKEEAARIEQERQQTEQLRIEEEERRRQEEAARIEQELQQMDQLCIEEEEKHRQEEAARIEQERLQMEQMRMKEEEERRRKEEDVRIEQEQQQTEPLRIEEEERRRHGDFYFQKKFAVPLLLLAAALFLLNQSSRLMPLMEQFLAEQQRWRQGKAYCEMLWRRDEEERMYQWCMEQEKRRRRQEQEARAKQEQQRHQEQRILNHQRQQALATLEILHNPNPSLDEIKHSFRTLAKTHHPDKNKADPDATKNFIRIKNAYEFLSW